MYDRFGRTLAYLDKADGWDYSVEAAGPEQAAVPAIVAEADLDGFRLSAANDFAAAPPGEKYLGAERFRVHLVGSVDPDGATHLTLSTIGGL